MQISRRVLLVSKLISKFLIPDFFAVSLSVQNVVSLHLGVEFCSVSERK